MNKSEYEQILYSWYRELHRKDDLIDMVRPTSRRKKLEFIEATLTRLYRTRLYSGSWVSEERLSKEALA